MLLHRLMKYFKQKAHVKTCVAPSALLKRTQKIQVLIDRHKIGLHMWHLNILARHVFFL